MAKEKVSFEQIERLQNQEVKPNGQVDNIDRFDRAFGRFFSKFGEYIVKNW